MINRFALFCVAVLWIASLAGQTNQPAVALKQEQVSHHVFTNCTLVLAPGEVVENGVLVIKDGLIVAAGQHVSIPKDAVVHNLYGMWVYPGFIDAHSHQGFGPIKKGPPPPSPQYGSKRTGPYSWNDAINAHYIAEDMYRPTQIEKDSLFKNGFTALNIIPSDGIFRGYGAIIIPGLESPSKSVLSGRSGMGLSFDKGSSTQEYPASLMGSIALMRQTFSDARWYAQAQEAYEKNPNQPKYEENVSLQAILQCIEDKQYFFFESANHQNTLRAVNIAKEFDIPMVFATHGDEYRRMEEFIRLKPFLVVSPDFPKALQIETAADERDIPLEYLRSWEQAPFVLRRLAEAGVPFSLSLTLMKEPGDFWKNLRKARAAGASEKALLTALTTAPASLLGVERQLGTLAPGKIANLVIASGNLFLPEASVYEVYTLGERHVLQALPREDIRGEYSINLRDTAMKLAISGPVHRPEVTLNGKKVPFANREGSLHISYPSADSPQFKISLVYMGEKGLSGYVESANGRREELEVPLIAPFTAEKTPPMPVMVAPSVPGIVYPGKAFGRATLPQQGRFVIRGATVWTNTDRGILPQADVLVENGKITAVGPGLQVPQGVAEISGDRKHVTAGIIDEHSHIAVSGALNEDSHAVTAEVRIGDVIDAEDIDIYRQLAGGVTSAHLLHGSANPIGGQSAIVRLRWGETAEGLKFQRGKEPKFIKFALGENVKQSNAGDTYNLRYPQTRMGVEQSIKEAFRHAKEYRAQQEEWEKTRKRDHLIPVRPDLQLEAIDEIHAGTRNITCHSYVQSEITMLIRLAEAEGFKVNTFTHVLEGFKIPEKILAHGATASSFADWWAYKFEVYDVTAYNPALLQERGINVCINSDDAEMARRLNQEAGKSIKYGGMSESEALKMVTLNPAKALHIDNVVGSVEPGKEADIVLWSDHPLSVYARAEKTFIEGRCYFDVEEDQRMRAAQATERARLIAHMRAASGDKQPTAAAFGGQRFRYQCCATGH